MTEKGYGGDQSSSSWDIPGPSSLAAILDTVYTSSASDNPSRNEEMECDALFAESDDEVEVLPTSSETNSAEAGEPVTKPVSSNYVNSTTPTQSYEVNLASVAPPVSSRTPVPEEYQPLPDSSSSMRLLDYALGGNNVNSANGQRFPDVNIRYQPKPVNHYCPYYSNYEAGVRPAVEYVLPRYHANNVIVRNYVQQHPVGYSRPQTADNNSTPMESDQAQTQPNDNNWQNDYLSHSVLTYNRNRSGQPQALERPSRKLNISPRRRQSKENETNTSLIEVSSEEEDNVSVPRKKTCDNGAGHQSSSSNPDISTNRTNSSHPNPAPHRVDIKREPQDHEMSEQGSEPTTISNPTTAHNCGRRNVQIHHPGPIFSSFHPNGTQIKQENTSCNCTNRSSCNCRTHHRTPGHNNMVHCHTPDHFHQNTHHHHHHHHHHHRMYRQCQQHNPAAGTSNTSLSRVKEEPGVQAANIKQETDPPVAQNVEEAVPTSGLLPVKVEAAAQPQVKIEPGVSNAQSSGVQSVIVKLEKDTERCCDINASGDRQVKEKSPQPGPSMGRTTQTNARPSGNVDQEVQTNSASTGVLSAPDLQLDWVSDSSSDDDVQVVQEYPNSRVVIDLTRSPQRPSSAEAARDAAAAAEVPPRAHACPADNLYEQSSLAQAMGGNRAGCRGCCCAPPAHAHAPAPDHAFRMYQAPPAHMGERRREVMSIAPPYLVHERLWQRQHHMLELQRRAMGELGGGFGHFSPYAMPPPPTAPFPGEYEPRDLRSNRNNEGITTGIAPAPMVLANDGQHVHHHMHHYLQLIPPHFHISIQPSVFVR